MRPKTLAVVATLLLALPTVLVLAPAADAQDAVPFAQGVKWVPQVNFEQRLFIDFGAQVQRDPVTGQPIDTNQPPCASTPTPSTTPGAPPQTGNLPTGGKYNLTPIPRVSVNPQNPRQPCSFAVAPGLGGASGSGVVEFATAPLLRNFSITGDDALHFQFQGNVPQGVSISVQVQSGGRMPITATFPAPANPVSSFSVALVPTSDDQRRFDVNQPITVKLTPTADASSGLSAPASWSISDSGGATYLSVRSQDAMRVATWTADEKSVTKTLFRPVKGEPADPPRIVGFFAVESPFGDADARGVAPGSPGGIFPNFTLVQNGQTVLVGPQRAGKLTGELNSTLSVAGSGRAVWNFPAGFANYRNFTNGDYSLQVEMRYHQGTAFASGVTSRFVISDQSLRITAYPGEVLSHDVLPGSSTTYLVLVENTGSSRDTFRLSATFTNDATTQGWDVRLGGPGFRDGFVDLAPAESKLITVTVRAPVAAVGAASTVVLSATSELDPALAVQPISIASRVSNKVEPGVGVIPPTRSLSVPAGEPTLFSVYLWNRGTTPANLTLRLNYELTAGWQVQLLQGNLPSAAVIASGVPPGDIALATIRVVGPTTIASSQQPVTLNVTHRDVNGIGADRPITFTTSSQGTLRIDIMDRIDAVTHVAETNWAAPQQVGIPGDPTGSTAPPAEDGLDGIWTRVWITNTGSAEDDFTVTATKQPDGCSSVAVPDGGTNFAVYARNMSGGQSIDPVRQIHINSGQTAELYVWRSIARDQPLDDDNNPATTAHVECSPDSFNYVITATGLHTGATAFQSGSILVVDNNPASDAAPFALEPVKRIDGYSEAQPYVDVKELSLQTITRHIQPGENASYFFRLTNAADHGEWTEPSGTEHKPIVGVRVPDVDATKGWRVLLRPNNGITDEKLNPFNTTYLLGNNVGDRRHGWVDQEIEVRVIPPNNTLAHQSFNAYIQAFQVGQTSTKTINLETIVSEFANLRVAAERTHVPTHPAEPAAFVIKLENLGSSTANVRLAAALDPVATTGGTLGWNVVTSDNVFSVPAGRTRTVSILATPPAGAVEGAQAALDVTVTYPRNPDRPSDDLISTPLRLTTTVVPQDSLSLTSPQTAVTVVQERPATFTLALTSTRTPVHYKVNVTQIPGWGAAVPVPVEDNITTSGAQTISVVFNVPLDAVNDSTYTSLVRVFEVGNEERNFDSVPLTITVRGGTPIAAISIPQLQKTVDRGQNQTFEVQISNTGNARGRINLEARTQDPGWTVSIGNVNDTARPYVDLDPGVLRTVNLTVRAPLNAPENTVVAVEVRATPQGTVRETTAQIQARVHDYGLDLTLAPAGADLVAGASTDVILKVKNRGNDNDTLNVSYASALELPEWTVTLSADRIPLEANAEREVRATIRSPQGQLPTPRAYTFKFYAGTLGGAAVNLSKNDTATVVVNVLRYQALDVDDDGQVELAVDLNKRDSDGFESFREISGEGAQTALLESAPLNGKSRFLLDVPADRLDGVADVWFDPEAVFAYKLVDGRAFDVTKDRTPEYFLDTDRDGKVDRAYDTDGDRYVDAREIDVGADQKVEYLVDTAGDSKPDRYYDPAGGFATDVVRTDKANVVGLDTNDDGRVDKYYDIQSGAITDATITQATGFLVKYWYFLLAFAAMVVVTIVLVVARRRRG
ncbi:MAG TPA: hypothetical protein VHH36_07935 [Candidatus Thermoplasmatota archaeon]|nr:hypothetical protein [Candidatus Thermoplasmatota archaeon]